MPEATLYDALERVAHDRPSHPSTVFYGASLSYAALRERIELCCGRRRVVEAALLGFA
jgi:fatty-acyl-CoA synthase